MSQCTSVSKHGERCALLDGHGGLHLSEDDSAAEQKERLAILRLRWNSALDALLDAGGAVGVAEAVTILMVELREREDDIGPVVEVHEALEDVVSAANEIAG